MDEEQERRELVKEATRELWQKMVDMERGKSLNEQEWREVLRKLDDRLKWLEGVVRG